MYNFNRFFAVPFFGFLLCLIGCEKEENNSSNTSTPTTKPYTVTTISGSSPGYTDGSVADAKFWDPCGLTVDAGGNIVVAESMTNRIRKITPAGMVSTVAGSGQIGDINGYQDGSAATAKFNRPFDVAIDDKGNIFVCDYGNNKIRRISTTGVVSTFAGSIDGYANGIGTNAQFDSPNALAIDPQQNIVVADAINHVIRRISPSALVTTVAGPISYPLMIGYVDGPAANARFESPSGIAIDPQGNIIVADTRNNCIRKISANGIVSTIAGNGNHGFKDGKGKDTEFNWPYAVVVDSEENVIVADTFNNRIRKIAPDGTVSTIAGNGASGDIGGFKDGVGTEALFNRPYGVAIDAHGNVIVSDTKNNRIRKITMK